MVEQVTVKGELEDLAEPAFNLYGIQATTNPVTPLIVVNGPIARELSFNGGGAPQTMDKSTQGQPGKYGMCIAENEAESPWEPYHVERSFDREASTVTAISVTGTQNVLDAASKSARALLRTFADSCAHVGAQNVQLGGGPLIVFCPEHAQILADGGFSKADVRRFIKPITRRRTAP